MFDVQEAVLTKIDKLVGTLKEKEELIQILKKKLTKKELKVFTAMYKNIEISQIAKEIHTDEERVKEIYKTTCKKLNQEKIKKELVNLS